MAMGREPETYTLGHATLGNVGYTGCSCCDNDPSCDHDIVLSHLTPETQELLKAAMACGEAYAGNDKQNTDVKLLGAALAFERAIRLGA